MLKIITTVGTSLFQNLEDDFDPNTKENWRSLDQEPAVVWEKERGNDHDSLDSVLGSIRSICSQPNFLARFSDPECAAETATLDKIIDETACGDAYEVYLLCTDTALSCLAAELLARYSPFLQGKTQIILEDGLLKNVSEGKPIKGLSISKAKIFKTEGLKNLVKEIRKIWKTKLDGNSATKNKIILNASGGYKGILPFLTLISQFYEFPICYKYQDDDDLIQELIKIDPIPFGFDWSLIYEIAPYLDQEWIKSAGKELSKKKNDLSLESSVLKEIKMIGKNGLHLMNKNNNNQITDIGLMLRAFYEGIDIDDANEVHKSTPEDSYRSKTNSAIMELIFNEWRHQFPYQEGDKIYSEVFRSSENEHLRLNNKTEFKSQIDIVLQTKDLSGFVIGEVKYAYKIGKELITHHRRQEQLYASDEAIEVTVDKYKGIESQFEKRLEDCIEQKPDEFHIYTFSAIPLNETQRKMLINSIDAIHKSLFRKTQIPVKAFYADVGSNPEAIATISLSSFNERIQQIYPTESHS